MATSLPWGQRRRAWLWAECLTLFFLAPLVAVLLRQHLAHRVIPVVLGLAGLSVLYLWREKGFDLGRLWRAEGLVAHARGILLGPLLALPVLIMLTYVLSQDKLFYFPLAHPQAWLALLIIYPLLAAYPQEVVFRGFFFRRYRQLFPQPWVMVLASGLSFGLAHLWYGNWVAPVISGLGGLLFGYRYLRSRSLLAVGLEHALWGLALFTVGLGWFFYSGSIN
ncbi:MAG: CPBP family glutamic-type intramembrane protease [Pseudomonadota bacterium]